MSFTVEDFHDLIELLAQHPEWRAELRRHVLSDELIELPALVRQLVEAQTRAEGRLEGIEARLSKLEIALTELASAQARTELQILELVSAQRRTEDRVGYMDGKMLEHDYARRGPSYFSPIARRLRVVDSGPLADLLDDAVDEGRLTESERETILLADLVLSGRRRDDGQDVYLLTEISVSIHPHDVERAADRAALLEKLGRPVLPVVAGREIDEQTAKLAHNRGVWYALGGRVTPPYGA
jgi:hypothetical protein